MYVCVCVCVYVCVRKTCVYVCEVSMQYRGSETNVLPSWVTKVMRQTVSRKNNTWSRVRNFHLLVFPTTL